jgi:hypothetical protein
MFQQDTSKMEGNKYYVRLEELIAWLDEHHYSTHYKKLNSMLHIISAIKA